MFNPTSKYDREQILAESLNVDKTQVICKKHMYVGSKRPPEPRGCADCIFAYYVWDLATTPPSKRQERLDELEHVIRRAIEFEQKGQWGKDFELYEPGDSRFQVQFEKDGEPDAH